MRARLLLGAIVAALPICLAAQAQAPTRPLLIGTGPVVGIYFPAGGAICNMVNRAAGSPVCAVVSSDGSAANLEALKSGAIDLAIVQSDWQYHAVKAEAAEAGGAIGLRAVFSLHGEPVTIVARADSGIAGVEDLKGKRVNLGIPGSPGRASAEALLAALGWDLKDLGAIAELAPDHQPSALCSGAIDAYILPTAHPSGAVAEATQGCGARLIPIAGEPAERLVADNPFYAFATIPGGTYPGNPDPIASFGLKATVVTRANVDAQVIYGLVKAVFDDFPAFAAQHPVFAGLQAQAMAHDGNTAPLHEGALRYFTERGW
ncbi:MAG TPA: TAXI family TRAP transporter solute-binding subunit [Alphaproteobacteria bacterium]|jgi:TRAP transporter TAXI family solute receptor|nr:TAXI family TRAP transporter solute-binding subunit [Alphaproteobacteria bacterium]